MSPSAAAQEVLRRYPARESSLIMVLQDLQANLGYLPPEAIDAVANGLSLPRSRVYGVATFYKTFSLTPRGRHRIDVCTGTACHVRGAGRLVNQLGEEMGIKPGGTTDDRAMSLDTVHCVGACALGPVILVDGKVQGEMEPRHISRLVKQCRKDEGACECADDELAPPPDPAAGIERIPNTAALGAMREQLSAERAEAPTLSICAGSGCRALGSAELVVAFQTALADAGLAETVRIQANGCHGFCEAGLAVVVRPQGIFYSHVLPEHAKTIVSETLGKGELVADLLYRNPKTGEPIPLEKDIPYYAKQTRRLMAANANLDPRRLDDYIASGGYSAMARMLGEISPDEVIECVKSAGLRGRGGAGFAAARKWASARRNPGETKYILCNADEGDPGAFMDCSLLEGNPHSIIEGMVIGAWAVAGPGSVGDPAAKGYVYVRGEYPMAVANLEIALAQARAAGLLGSDILGSGLSYDIEISRGGGAFVCGESTALMASIEGKAGEPRAKYVHTAERGLFGGPTVLNNVETWANVPLIMAGGHEAFAAVGTERSKGTKIFSLVGKVANTGLVEVPMGTTLREIVYGIGGGIPGGKAFKAVQTGGPSGGCLPTSHLDTPVDFDALSEAGAMMGSGGMIVMDETTCMVDVARYFTSFLANESCGKCTACRLGLENLAEILDRICCGEGEQDDFGKMERLFDVLDEGSLCGLGKSAANPVRSTLNFFRNEYEAHINDRKCPAGVCRDLISYYITDTCGGCHLCFKACPQEAINGVANQMHSIDPTLCDRCGICVAACPEDAIVTI